MAVIAIAAWCLLGASGYIFWQMRFYLYMDKLFPMFAPHKFELMDWVLFGLFIPFGPVAWGMGAISELMFKHKWPLNNKEK